MWGEGVDASNFDAFVWRDLAAIAERLWSPAARTQKADAAAPRLAQHLCRLTRAGFRPGPVAPGYCPPLGAAAAAVPPGAAGEKKREL